MLSTAYKISLSGGALCFDGEQTIVALPAEVDFVLADPISRPLQSPSQPVSKYRSPASGDLRSLTAARRVRLVARHPARSTGCRFAFNWICHQTKLAAKFSIRAKFAPY